MDKIIKKFSSFLDQEVDDIQYWQNLPGNKKIEILEYIRLNYWAMKNESPPRLQRISRIIKRK